MRKGSEEYAACGGLVNSACKKKKGSREKERKEKKKVVVVLAVVQRVFVSSVTERQPVRGLFGVSKYVFLKIKTNQVLEVRIRSVLDTVRSRR